MHFHIFQPELILTLCLNLHEPQPIYPYKRYTYNQTQKLPDVFQEHCN